MPALRGTFAALQRIERLGHSRHAVATQQAAAGLTVRAVEIERTLEQIVASPAPLLRI